MNFARIKSTKKMGFLSSILFIILSITLYQSLFHHSIVAAKKDVLNAGDEVNSIDSTSYLVSANGNFTLGFFTIPSTKFTYLGIWYTNTHRGRKVWVANRDIPMTGGGVLMVDNSSTLKVVNGSGITLFNVFYNLVGSGKNNKTRAVLEDSGNFLVYDGSNQTLWQSFDQPTDILISGMKIGYNLTTKQNWTLTSWLSDQVPASGSFTMRLEPYQNSPQLLVYRHGVVYRASGPSKNGTFQFLDSWLSRANFPSSYYMSLILDASGSMYITFHAIDDSTLRLTPGGEVSTNESPNVEADFCYASDSGAGCVVSTPLLPTCRGQSDIFRFRSGDWINWPSNKDDNSSISLSDCMERCWNDCDCVGFITSNSNGTGCRTWIQLAKYMQFDEDPFGNTQGKYVSASLKFPAFKPWKSIALAVSFVLISVLATLLCYVRIRRRRLKGKENRRRDDFILQLTASNSFNYGDELERGIKDAPDVKIFSLKAILTATDNFSNVNKLGQGGYGPVYKGELSDGRKIAIKRLAKTSRQGILEFKSELILISKLQHMNLVRLYGCCIHQEEKMLIYEFMPNKSLDFFLFAQDEKERIGWQIRFNIIEGVAQGLLYLHKYSRLKVIHRDLKVGNVLLDQNMNPKIADFGMARIFEQNVSEAVTNRVVGTYGYMAPEYAMEGTFSIKSDVFSFGVLILEIVSGRRNSSFYNTDRPLNLVGYAWELWKGHASLELKDETLGESFDVKQLLRVIHVGLLCVQENADDRPTMLDVIYILNNETTDLPSPKQPAFFTGRQMTRFRLAEARSTEYLLGRQIQVSENGLTITTMEAR